jgi:DNA mismatch endonuclease Vsr
VTRPPATDAATSARLGRVRQKGTSLELEVGRLLRSIGVRYRLQNRDLPGSPDFANRKQRWAVFAHGCFWHAHPGCARATIPKRNHEFWATKLARNRQRDAEVVAALEAEGFRVLTIWACEVERDSDSARRALEVFLRSGPQET